MAIPRSLQLILHFCSASIKTELSCLLWGERVSQNEFSFFCDHFRFLSTWSKAKLEVGATAVAAPAARAFSSNSQQFSISFYKRPAFQASAAASSVTADC